MTRLFLTVTVVLSAYLVALAGCASSGASSLGRIPIRSAICVLQPTEGHTCSGVVRFVQAGGSVKVIADVSGLTSGAQHAIHIHEFGDVTSDDGTSAGGHYNPQGNRHGLPTTARRHAGDLGNLTADSAGNAHYEVTVSNISITGPKNPIVGRAVVVHAKADTGAQPTGAAGPRIAVGAIGIAKADR